MTDDIDELEAELTQIELQKAYLEGYIEHRGDDPDSADRYRLLCERHDALQADLVRAKSRQLMNSKCGFNGA